MSFDRVFEFIIDEETGGDPNGGYNDRPADAGGPTKWGISQRAHPDVDIAALTKEEALAIYRRDYWNKVRADEIDAYEVQLALVDYAVNSGVAKAVVALQNEVTTKVDRVVGPVTLGLTKAAIQYRGAKPLAMALLDRRVRRLSRIVRRRPSQLVFLTGWWRRTVRLAAAIERG